jgi:hypothetical protein
MKHENRSANGRWLKGTTGNAAGRGTTNRQRISEKLLADLASVWETHGESVLERLALTDPAKLATIAYGLLPRDLFISVQQQAPGGLDAESWASLRRVLDLIESCGANGEPQEVFEMIEEDLRARLAKPVEGT